MGKTIIKVFLSDGQFKSLSVDDTQTSREIEQMMIKKLQKNTNDSFSDWRLFESLEGGKVIQQMAASSKPFEYQELWGVKAGDAHKFLYKKISQQVNPADLDASAFSARRTQDDIVLNKSTNNNLSQSQSNNQPQQQSSQIQQPMQQPVSQPIQPQEEEKQAPPPVSGPIVAGRKLPPGAMPLFGAPMMGGAPPRPQRAANPNSNPNFQTMPAKKMQQDGDLSSPKPMMTPTRATPPPVQPRIPARQPLSPPNTAPTTKPTPIPNPNANVSQTPKPNQTQENSAPNLAQSVDKDQARKQGIMKWVNSKFGNSRVNDLENDLNSGVVLCELASILTGSSVSFNSQPSSSEDKVSNISSALSSFQMAGVQTNGIEAQSIEQGDTKSILNLMFLILKQYKDAPGATTPGRGTAATPPVVSRTPPAVAPRTAPAVAPRQTSNVTTNPTTTPARVNPTPGRVNAQPMGRAPLPSQPMGRAPLPNPRQPLNPSTTSPQPQSTNSPQPQRTGVAAQPQRTPVVAAGPARTTRPTLPIPVRKPATDPNTQTTSPSNVQSPQSTPAVGTLPPGRALPPPIRRLPIPQPSQPVSPQPAAAAASSPPPRPAKPGQPAQPAPQVTAPTSPTPIPKPIAQPSQSTLPPTQAPPPKPQPATATTPTPIPKPTQPAPAPPTQSAKPTQPAPAPTSTPTTQTTAPGKRAQAPAFKPESVKFDFDELEAMVSELSPEQVQQQKQQQQQQQDENQQEEAPLDLNELIESTDALIAKSTAVRKASIATAPIFTNKSQLIIHMEQLKQQKSDAIEAEDFQTANNLKKQIVQLEQQLASFPEEQQEEEEQQQPQQEQQQEQEIQQEQQEPQEQYEEQVQQQEEGEFVVDQNNNEQQETQQEQFQEQYEQQEQIQEQPQEEESTTTTTTTTTTTNTPAPAQPLTKQYDELEDLLAELSNEFS